VRLGVRRWLEQVARNWSFFNRKAQFYKLEVAEEVDRGSVKDLATCLANRGYQVRMRWWRHQSTGFGFSVAARTARSLPLDSSATHLLVLVLG
jgi:hypothetical protein